MQFFQEVTDPPVPVASDKHIEAFQSFNCHRSVRAGETQDLNLILFNPHLNRLPDIVSLVIYSVCKALLNGSVRVVEEAVSLRSIRMLDNTLFDNAVSDVLQRFPQLLMKRPSENLFFNLIPTDSFREFHNINLCAGNIFFRLHAEEEESHVLGLHEFRYAVGNTHIDAKTVEIYIEGVKNNIAPYRGRIGLLFDRYGRIDYIRYSQLEDAIGEAAGLESSGHKRAAKETQRAVIFLEDMLANGPVEHTIIKQKAAEAGISLPTLNRAKKQCGMTSKRLSRESSVWR